MPQPQINLVILFVNKPLESGAFYGRLLGLKPIEQSPTFVLFALANGLMLGLWSHTTAEPPVAAEAGGSEICLSVDNVDEMYEKWMGYGIPMAQIPTDMDFGRTFVALDPDGHRVRVYRLHEV